VTTNMKIRNLNSKIRKGNARFIRQQRAIGGLSLKIKVVLKFFLISDSRFLIYGGQIGR